MSTTIPSILTPFDSFPMDVAVVHAKTLHVHHRAALDPAMAAVTDLPIDALKSWVRNNRWYQEYQSNVAAGKAEIDAALEAQEVAWPGRRQSVGEKNFSIAAIGLIKFYNQISDALEKPVIPAGTITEIHRGHALHQSDFDLFINDPFSKKRRLLSFTSEPPFVPYYYASHNCRNLMRAGGNSKIIPYIMHISLKNEAQNLIWISQEVAKNGMRDDGWQAEIIAPAHFNAEITRIDEEKCGDFDIKHIYCDQL